MSETLQNDLLSLALGVANTPGPHQDVARKAIGDWVLTDPAVEQLERRIEAEAAGRAYGS